MPNPARTEKIIGVNFQKYQELRSEVTDPVQWLREYGFYLFRSSKETTQAYGLVVGPEDSLYQGSLLLVSIVFPPDFPFNPPRIENLLSFPKQFNTNLWSNDVRQDLITKTDEYRPFYGLICMDILNTPHSKITINSYGEQVEVYDKSLEQYTPVLSTNAILIALRSNILNGETRCSYITDTGLQYLNLVYLGHHCEEKISQEPELANLKDLNGESLLEIVRRIRTHYREYYRRVAEQLLTEDKRKEVQASVNEFKEDLITTFCQ